MPKGWISFTVDALHNTNDLFFDFLEKEFKILEVDHSEVHNNVVSLLLEDPEYKWFVPTIAAEVHRYVLEVERQEDHSHAFKVTLID